MLRWVARNHAVKGRTIQRYQKRFIVRQGGRTIKTPAHQGRFDAIAGRTIDPLVGR